MKKLLTIAFAFLATVLTSELKAQNVQLLYDTGRNCVTSTVEMFRPDNGGSTYFFVDMDYTPQITGAYWEIAREFNFWQDTRMGWLSAHIEYNGGLVTGFAFSNNLLAGLTYSGHSEDYSKTWSLSAMYKSIFSKPYMHSFQITGVWGIDFAKGWCSFSGFFDFWRENMYWENSMTRYIFMSEPQFWVNLNKIKGWDKVNLSIGGEVELSANFVDKGFHVMPAVGAKYTF